MEAMGWDEEGFGLRTPEVDSDCIDHFDGRGKEARQFLSWALDSAFMYERE
jgi:hypothetical protein